MNKKEKEIIGKVIEYTRIYKPLNPADVHGVVQQSHHSHYAMEYLETILTGLIDKRYDDVNENLEMLKENFDTFQDKVSIKR